MKVTRDIFVPPIAKDKYRKTKSWTGAFVKEQFPWSWRPWRADSWHLFYKKISSCSCFEKFWLQLNETLSVSSYQYTWYHPVNLKARDIVHTSEACILQSSFLRHFTDCFWNRGSFMDQSLTSISLILKDFVKVPCLQVALSIINTDWINAWHIWTVDGHRFGKPYRRIGHFASVIS